jgi:hypothetical protein
LDHQTQVWILWLLAAVYGLLFLLTLIEVRSGYMTRGRRSQLDNIHAEQHVLDPHFPLPGVHLVARSGPDPIDWQAEGWFADTAETPAVQPVQPAVDGDTIDSP